MAPAMELRWIDESEMRLCDLSELSALRSRYRRVPLARHTGME